MKNELRELDRDSYSLLKKKAGRYKPKQKIVFDTYSYFMKYRQNLKTADNLIIAISIAYSWMPTMLDIYDHSEKTLKGLIPEIKALSKITNAKELEDKKDKVIETLKKLCRATNNSVVGASKVLHMYYPMNIPIFDSRTVLAWNDLFKSKDKKLSINSNKQVENFYNYWMWILIWRRKLQQKGVRKIEKLLFDYGRYLAEKKTKKKQKINE